MKSGTNNAVGKAVAKNQLTGTAGKPLATTNGHAGKRLGHADCAEEKVAGFFDSYKTKLGRGHVRRLGIIEAAPSAMRR